VISYMHNAYKIFKLFSHTTTLKVGSYRFANKENVVKVLKNNTNGALLGATESHIVPIRLNDKKVSMYNNSKEIEPLTKQEFDELMKIVS
jgi:hypothetical protein